MSKLSAADAAFYGFGLIKRDPLTFLGVALVLFGVGLYCVLVVIPAYAKTFTGVLTTIEGGDPKQLEAVDATQMMQAMSELWTAVGPLYLIGILGGAIMLGAMNRSLVFGQSKGWVLGLKLGMDELRAIVVTIIGYVLAFLPGYALIIAVMMATVGVAVGAAAGGGEPAAAGAAALLVFPAFIAGFALMIWIGIRLSLAVPASIGERRWVIFESWSMTKGRFWTLFLAYLILFIIIWLVEMVILAILMTVFGAALLPALTTAGAEEIDFSAWADLPLVPIGVAGAAVYALVTTFFYGAFYGVAARGYQDWKAQSSAQAQPA